MNFLEEVRGDKYAASKLIQELAEMFPILTSSWPPFFFYKKDGFTVQIGSKNQLIQMQILRSAFQVETRCFTRNGPSAIFWAGHGVFEAPSNLFLQEGTGCGLRVVCGLLAVLSHLGF